MVCVLVGGASFWTLTTVIEVLTRRELNLAVGTLVPLAGFLPAYFLVRQRSHLRNTALWMLVGVFVLGPLYWMVGRTAFSGGFTQPTGWESLLLLVVAFLFPPTMFVLAGYEGTLFALLLVTVLIPVLQWQNNRRNTSH